MKETKRQYREILKTTSLFGGVQIFSVLISIAKSKIAAILIGPTGFGILGLLNSTLDLIVGFTKLGLDVSAVKEIASNKEPNQSRSKTINALRNLTWYTGIFGAVIMVLCSTSLSQLVFGNKEHTYSFVFISLAVLFTQLTTGNHAVLQGLRKLNQLAKSTVLASFCSLIVAIPLYYFYGISGIVPVIILTSFFTYLLSIFFVKKEIKQKQNLTFKETVQHGKLMIKLGFVLSLGSLATILTFYLIQIFITKIGGVDEVGFYNSAFIVINAYVGVIFTALSKDYFPRLSSIANDNDLVSSSVNQQVYVTVLMITPIIILFLSFIPYIIQLLFTQEFVPIIGILTFGILATLFKAVAWSISYIIVAKGHSKLYICIEISFNILLLIMSGLGYLKGGLTGVGICYLIYYSIYLISVKWITYKKFNFRFSKQLYKILIICSILCSMAYLGTLISNKFLKYSLLSVIVLASIIFSIIALNKETDIIKRIKIFK